MAKDPKPAKQQPIKAADLDGGASEPRTIVVGGPGDDDDDEVEPELAAAPDEPPPELPKAAPAGQPAAPTVIAAVPYQPRVVYSPDRNRHMSEMGPVATRNFTAVVRGCRVDVKFGAPRKRIPSEVIELMARAGVEFGHAAPPDVPAGQGASATRQRRTEPPRARRTERRADEPERRFRPAIQSISAQQAY